MRKKLVCRSAEPNNGIVKIHLTRDVYANRQSQPTDIFINITKSELRGEEFRPGDEWMVTMELMRRARASE